MIPGITFRYDENQNGIYTYNGVDIYYVLIGKYTVPNSMKEYFCIGSIRDIKDALTFTKLEDAVNSITSGIYKGI